MVGCMKLACGRARKLHKGQDVCTEVMGRINLGACLMERRFVLTPRWRDGLARLCYYAPILMH